MIGAFRYYEDYTEREQWLFNRLVVMKNAGINVDVVSQIFSKMISRELTDRDFESGVRALNDSGY